MNLLDKRDIQLHVSILGWLYIAVNALFLAIALFSLGLLPLVYTSVAFSDPDSAGILNFLGTAFGTLMLILGLPGLIAGYGLLKHKPWARLLALVLGFLGLVNFPIGTLMGIYTLLVLLQQSAAEYFEPRQLT